MKKKNHHQRTLVVTGVLLALIILVRMTGLNQAIRLENATILRDWVAGFGPAGPLVYIVFYIAACLLFLPGLPITVLGALSFGPVLGTVYTSIGSTLGATAAFLTARYAARGSMEAWLGDHPTFHRIDEGVEIQGWRMLLVTRMVPLFPFNLQNYAYGLTNISVGTYVAVSWFCMIPGTIAYNFLAGSMVAGKGNVDQMFIYLGIGALFFVFVTMIPHWIRRRQKGLTDD